MNPKAEDIIEYITKHHPPIQPKSVQACVDYRLSIGNSIVNQHILGVTSGDPFGSGISHYEFNIKKELETLNAEIKCLGWPYESESFEDMKDVLNILAEHFGIQFDVDRMTRDLNNSFGKWRTAYIVITVLQYNIAQAAT
ncbi:MAG: hypothetical protein ABWZ25_17530 [Chitinophagaceae bacterium]